MQFVKSKTDLQASSKRAERYWMATLILIVLIIACIGIIVNLQMEVNNCLRGHSEFRNKIKTLAELKEKIEEENSRAVILKKQTDRFLNRMFSNEDRLVKDAKECELHLRQLLQNATALASEKNDYARKYHLVIEQLAACEAKKTS